MSDIDDPLERMTEDLRKRNQDKDLDFYDPNWLQGEDTDDADVERHEPEGQSRIVSDGERDIARIDYMPKNGSFGVARPNPKGEFPQNPQHISEGHEAYENALDEADRVIKGN